MPGPATLSYYTTRGTVYYTPSDLYAEKERVTRLPSPPCRPRQRRPHSIHITRLPAGFVPFDLRPLPPPPEPKKPSRFRLELRKLASRENAKRVLGSVFPPFGTSSSSSSSTSSSSTTTSTSTTTTTTATTSTSSTASSSAANSTRSVSPDTTRIPSIHTPATPRTSLSLASTALSIASSDPTTIFARRAASGLVELPSEMSAAPAPASASRPSLSTDTSTSRSRSASLALGGKLGRHVHEGEKPVCAGNGIACYFDLQEPCIYLSGLDPDGTTRDSEDKTMSVLRGKLRVVVSKSAKIRSIYTKWHGRARTEWPEGIPNNKSELCEEDSFRNYTTPYFNFAFPGAESYGSECIFTPRDSHSHGGNASAASSVTNLASTLDGAALPSQSGGFLGGLGTRGSRSSTLLSMGTNSKDLKRLSLQSNQSRSFGKGDSPSEPPHPKANGYKVFHPGTYEYPVEVTIDNNSPESLELHLASVKWELECFVERAGAFKTNLQGSKEIPVIRSPSPDSMELTEPISISRRWEDQLHYEIMISGKSFPLGSKIPIAFKLTPLAKVQIHKLKVFVSENIEYHAKDRKVTRREAGRKILLLEKSAGKPLPKEYTGSEVNTIAGGERDPQTRQQNRAAVQRRREREAAVRGSSADPLPEPVENILGDIDLGLDTLIGPTEIEMNVQLPTCDMMKADKTKLLHPNCTWKNVDVNHWIKIVMRISRQDADDPTGKKRRHFEISIDSPISLLSCRATRANLALPAYGSDITGASEQYVCGCPNAAVSNSSPSGSSGSGNLPTLNSMAAPAEVESPHLARPPQAHLSTNAASGVQRPIHLLRAPSFSPPQYEDDAAPPPMVTPPPQYDNVIGTPSVDGLADYFARLSDFEDDHDDGADTYRVMRNGRVNVPSPFTPGGRIARSMDIDRNFMFSSEAFNNTRSSLSGFGGDANNDSGSGAITPQGRRSPEPSTSAHQSLQT